MLKSICSIISGLCMIAGIVSVIGTVGSYDLDLITSEVFISRVLIGMGITFGGYFGLYMIDYCKYR